jgi:RND family efflux transporter MFP subunit
VNRQVICEVDDVSNDSINGTPIIWIIDNGVSVKEGDLIVELDAATLRERLDVQLLEVEEERAEFKTAEVQYENQITQNVTLLEEAKLKVQLADLALKQFGDEEAGTFQLDLQDLELQVQEAEAGQLIEQTNLKGVETLYKLGYRSSGELAEARLNALRAERQLATAISRKQELVEYEKEKQELELRGALESAQRNLEQVGRDNEAQLVQADARLKSAKEQLFREEEVLKRYQSQLAKCKIYAPQDGMVAYWSEGSRWRREEIRAGAPVRFRQPILTLPDLRKMQVKTAIHESVLDQVKPGQPATVRVDAFPDLQYRASVTTVAVLPDQGGWMSSDTKVYETVVKIDEAVDLLKPGMTAVVDIHAASLTNIVAVPVQAIIQIESENWIYVEEKGKPVRRCVTLGQTNTRFVEVRSGLDEGERVVLNPSAIHDDKLPSRSESNEESETMEEESVAEENVVELS